MRNIARIKVYCDVLRNNKEEFNKILNHPVSIDEIESKWLKSPDLRLGQFLINTFRLKDSLIGYKTEGYELLNKWFNIPYRELLLWGTNFDKNMNPLKETKHILIKDMSEGHLESLLLGILNRQFKAPSEIYLKTLLREYKLK